MARSKSPTGSKSKAVSNDNNKDQVGFNPSSSAAAVTAAAEAKPVENVASADLKAESRKLEVVKSEPGRISCPSTWKMKSGAGLMNSTSSAEKEPEVRPMTGSTRSGKFASAIASKVHSRLQVCRLSYTELRQTAADPVAVFRFAVASPPPLRGCLA